MTKIVRVLAAQRAAASWMIERATMRGATVPAALRKVADATSWLQCKEGTSPTGSRRHHLVKAKIGAQTLFRAT